jgi:beta-glucosidase/6-phospho-beta-glucosidase/beta-galactosidase
MNIFNSYLMGGFECSTHKKRGGERLDLIAATRHDRFAEADYARLLEIGMRTARDGVRWHLIEPEPFRYDFSSLENQTKAARKTGIQIIWDLFHYGFPDDLDIFSPAFVERFAAFSAATAGYLKSATAGTLFICPVNEISFFSWIAGEVGGFYPFARKRGAELKRQLVKATIGALDAIRATVSDVRFVQTDPAIHVTTGRTDPAARRRAENYRRAQFEAFDMLIGKTRPELGGAPRYLDIIGLNYYFHNQWFYPNRRKIMRDHPLYRPLHGILEEFSRRYERPLMIAETGIEDDARADWFRFICEESRIARARGVALEGLCLYPIANHPGWDDNRYCHNGLWEYADENGDREIHEPLAQEILYQLSLFEENPWNVGCSYIYQQNSFNEKHTV